MVERDDLTAIELYGLVLVVNRDRGAHMKAAASFTERSTDGIGDVVSGNSGCRYLIEQGEKCLIVITVNDGDIRIMTESFCRR